MRKSLVARMRRRVRQLSGLSSCVEARRGLDLLDLQRRAQDGREVADVLGDQEVVLHEALDRAQAAALDVAEPLRHGRLHVEGQPLLGAPGQEVQVAAHRPQEVLAAAEGGVLLGGEDLRLHRRRRSTPLP